MSNNKVPQDIQDAAEEYDDNLHIYETARSGFEQGALWERNRDKWIAITPETLPKENEVVIIYSSDTDTLYVGCYCYGNEPLYNDLYGHYENVTHWQPLPELPKSE